jgi:hypothetical protein
MKMIATRRFSFRAVLGAVLLVFASSFFASPPASAAVRYVRHCYWSHGYRHCSYHRYYYHRHYYRHSYCYYHRCHYYYRHGWNNR